jgi:hypothetical protein
MLYEVHIYLVGRLEFPFNASKKERLNHIIFTAQKYRSILTKKYGFMPRVTILCHFQEKLCFYINIYIYMILQIELQISMICSKIQYCKDQEIKKEIYQLINCIY